MPTGPLLGSLPLFSASAIDWQRASANAKKCKKMTVNQEQKNPASRLDNVMNSNEVRTARQKGGMFHSSFLDV